MVVFAFSNLSDNTDFFQGLNACFQEQFCGKNLNLKSFIAMSVKTTIAFFTEYSDARL